MNILYTSELLDTQLIYPLPIFLFNLSNWKPREIYLKDRPQVIAGVSMEMHLIEAAEGELYGLEVSIYRCTHRWKQMYGIDKTCRGKNTTEEKVGHLLYRYWMNYYIEMYHNDYPFLQLDKNRGQLKKTKRDLIKSIKVLPPFFRRKMLLNLYPNNNWRTTYEKRTVPIAKLSSYYLRQQRHDHSRRVYGA